MKKDHFNFQNSFLIVKGVCVLGFIAWSPLSSLISFHWNAFCTLLVPSHRAFFHFFSLSRSLPRCYFTCLKFFLHLNPGLRWFNLWISTQLLV